MKGDAGTLYTCCSVRLVVFVVENHQRDPSTMEDGEGGGWEGAAAGSASLESRRLAPWGWGSTSPPRLPIATDPGGGVASALGDGFRSSRRSFRFVSIPRARTHAMEKRK